MKAQRGSRYTECPRS